MILLNKVSRTLCCILLSLHALAQTDSLSQNAHNEDPSNDSIRFSPFRFSLVATASAGIITLAHLQNYNSWWKGERGPFHVAEDGTQYLHADKLGHLYFTYVTSDMISRSLHWSGIEPHEAYLYGGGLALAFQLYVEVEDAFHPELGFSVGDAAADIAGAAFPALKQHYPLFKPVTIKWSAIPSVRYNRGEYRTLLDDYESQYYWLSVNIEDALGDACPTIIPSFLNLAVGYGVKNLDGQGNGTPELYLSLDCDFTRLPGEGSFLSALKHILNYIHCPAPTVRLSPEITFYGVRF